LIPSAVVELQVASMLSNIEFSPYPGTAVILGQKKERKRSERLLTDNFNRNYVRFLTDDLREAMYDF